MTHYLDIGVGTGQNAEEARADGTLAIVQLAKAKDNGALILLDNFDAGAQS